VVRIGYDIIGIDPTSKEGEYFRNNLWWWPGLWEFVCNMADDILTEQDMVQGMLNNGREIGKNKARGIGQRLHRAVINRDDYEAQVRIAMKVSDIGQWDEAESIPEHTRYGGRGSRREVPVLMGERRAVHRLLHGERRIPDLVGRAPPQRPSLQAAATGFY